MNQLHKMHGLGNDFILIEDILPQDYNISQMAIELCHRNTGIGADGLLLLLPSDNADYKMRIINSDGSEAEMCGNGIRCFAKYIFENKDSNKTNFEIETLAGIIKPEIIKENTNTIGVKVNMGKPLFSRKDIPMTGTETDAIHQTISVCNQTFDIAAITVGVPHTMVFIDDLQNIDIHTIGKAIENHPLFPKRTNVNFVQVINESEITVRTWERGAGATLACGTGSCASAIASHLRGYTKAEATVHLSLGDLQIQYLDPFVYMTGPATDVFSTYVDLDVYGK